MNVFTLEQHISAATAALGRNRAPSNGSGSEGTIRGGRSQIGQGADFAAWSEDYGPGIKTATPATVDAARLSHGSGGHSDGVGSASGKDRLDHGGGWSAKTLWRAMTRHLCNGTKFFAVCAGIATFIIVV